MSAPHPTHRPEPDGPPCVIGPGCRFQGLLSFRGEALVAGRLEGEVHARGTLWLAESARVRGSIDVDALVVSGAVDGEIQAAERVELRATARVRGPLRTPRLAVAEGARFEGPVRMAPVGPAGEGTPPAP